MDKPAQEAAAPSRAARTAAALLQGATGVALQVVAGINAKFETIFEQLEMRFLPLPTEAFIALARFLRLPLGMALLGLVTVGLIALTLRGSLDRVLRKLIWANILVWLLGIPFWVLSIFVPIIKIQQHLNK